MVFSEGGSSKTAIENYLYPQIIKALGSKRRWKILKCLYNQSDKIRIDELGALMGKMSEKELLRHITVLQMGDLAIRSVRLEERRRNPDPYFGYIELTKPGRMIVKALKEAME